MMTPAQTQQARCRCGQGFFHPVDRAEGDDFLVCLICGDTLEGTRELPPENQPNGDYERKVPDSFFIDAWVHPDAVSLTPDPGERRVIRFDIWLPKGRRRVYTLEECFGLDTLLEALPRGQSKTILRWKILKKLLESLGIEYDHLRGASRICGTYTRRMYEKMPL